jgi:hypothetical protein
MHQNDSGSDDPSEGDFYASHTLQALRDKLLGDYAIPSAPPASASPPCALAKSEMLSLKHYVAWQKSNGTVQAYKLHARVLEDATEEKILTLYSARKLATHLTQMCPMQVDIFPQAVIFI